MHSISQIVLWYIRNCECISERKNAHWKVEIDRVMWHPEGHDYDTELYDRINFFSRELKRNTTFWNGRRFITMSGREDYYNRVNFLPN